MNSLKKFMSVCFVNFGKFCLKLKDKIAKSLIGVGMMKLISIPVGLAASIILARVLGPEQYGQYAFIMALIPLLALPVTGGLSQLLTREVAIFAHAKSWKLYNGALKGANGWVMSVSALIVVLTLLASKGFGLLPAEGKFSLLPIAILMVPFLGFAAVRSGATKGLGRPAYAEIPQQLLQPSMMLILFSAMAWSGLLNVKSAIWGQVSIAGLIFIIASWMFFRVKPIEAQKVKSESKMADWGRALLPFSLLALMSTFNTQVGIVFLGFLSSNDQTAAMQVAERAGQFVALSLTLTNMVIAPYIVQANRDGDKVKLQKLARSCARVGFFLSLPIFLVFLFGGEWLIGLAFGKDYAAISYMPVVILAFGHLLNVFFGSVGHLLTMSGYEKYTLLGQLTAVFSNIILCSILVPLYGSIGAAIAVSISLILWNIVLSYFVMKKLKIRATAF